MRKAVILVLGVMLVATAAFAERPINWTVDVPGTGRVIEPYDGQSAVGWFVAIFKSTDDIMDGFEFNAGGDVVSTGDDVFANNKETGGAPITTAIPNVGGAVYWFQNTMIETGIKAFTVVFNDADMNSATHFLIVDDDMFTPSPGNVTSQAEEYNPGGASAGEWAVITPEPSSMVLMALGLVALVVRRVRRK